ncbi:Alpha/Beta hydrolase protein [Spinellus fusiger]|nr:Alpha/Beta hydrolase protein [Spinellus fusiger]
MESIYLIYFLILILIILTVFIYLFSLVCGVRIHYDPSPIEILLKSSKARKIRFVDLLRKKCPSLIGPKAVFYPTPYLFNGHLQTGFSTLFASECISKVQYERELIILSDGGKIALDWCSPSTSHENDDTPTIIFLHGLTGNSKESYIIDVVSKLNQEPYNYRCVILNSRGCGDVEITTPRITSCADTDDLKEVIQYIEEKLAPGTPLIGIGFSAGSNILVKYLGEEEENTPLKAAISIANPFDLLITILRSEENTVSSKVYSAVIVKNLKSIYEKQSKGIKRRRDIDHDKVKSANFIREYDQELTRKMRGYTTVSNYYRSASCFQSIEKVRIPLLCINALDDPISLPESIPYDEVKLNPYVILATTQYGGHLGWFENTLKTSRWIDKPITEFASAMFELHDNHRDRD